VALPDRDERVPGRDQGEAPARASLASLRDVPWLEPYPDQLLDEAAPPSGEPGTALIGRETIELTFLAMVQLLPARQRAVLVLREVLDWLSAEAAALLEISVAAVNSALQRARATLREQLPPDRPRARDTGTWRLLPTRANRQPAAASYLRRPGATDFTAFKLDVLRVADGAIAEITTFGVKQFPAFALPERLD
jgi:hypothetical protein